MTSQYDDLPISALSPEILVEIFEEAQRTPWGEREGRRLLQITWVCRHWRNVALHAPTLWAYIGTNHAGYALEFLKRSKQAKLDVTLAWWMSEELALAVASQTHRIKELSLITGPNPGDLLVTPAPILQAFDMHEYPVPEALFAGFAPELSELSVHECPSVTCSAIPTCPLQMLSLRAPEPRLGLNDVVEMLARFPTLESAYLHSLFDESNLGGAGSKTVNLPKLNWMHLGDVSIRLAIQFLKHVKLNTFTRFSTMINRDEVTTTNILELFWLSVTAGSSLVQKLQINQDSGWIYGHTHLLVATTSKIEHWINHMLSWDETMTILKQLPLDHLEDVELLMCKPLPPIEMWTMIANAPIHHLHLGYNAASAFIPFISSPSHDDAMPFPSLRSLVLEDMYNEVVFLQEDWDRLCDIFRVRAERGFGLESLWMKSTRPAEEFPMDVLTVFIPKVKVSPQAN